jgi:hypothetical protein
MMIDWMSFVFGLLTNFAVLGMLAVVVALKNLKK